MPSQDARVKIPAMRLLSNEGEQPDAGGRGPYVRGGRPLYASVNVPPGTRTCGSARRSRRTASAQACASCAMGGHVP